MHFQELCLKLYLFPWLAKVAEKKGICGFLNFPPTPFPFITLAPGATFLPTATTFFPTVIPPTLPTPTLIPTLTPTTTIGNVTISRLPSSISITNPPTRTMNPPLTATSILPSSQASIPGSVTPTIMTSNLNTLTTTPLTVTRTMQPSSTSILSTILSTSRLPVPVITTTANQNQPSSGSTNPITLTPSPINTTRTTLPPFSMVTQITTSRLNTIINTIPPPLITTTASAISRSSVVPSQPVSVTTSSIQLTRSSDTTRVVTSAPLTQTILTTPIITTTSSRSTPSSITSSGSTPSSITSTLMSITSTPMSITSSRVTNTIPSSISSTSIASTLQTTTTSLGTTQVRTTSGIPQVITTSTRIPQTSIISSGTSPTISLLTTTSTVPISTQSTLSNTQTVISTLTSSRDIPSTTRLPPTTLISTIMSSQRSTDSSSILPTTINPPASQAASSSVSGTVGTPVITTGDYNPRILAIPTYGQMPCNVKNEGTYGICVNLKKCPYMINLIVQQSTHPKPDVTEYIQQSFCGFDKSETKVCCPKAKKNSSATRTTQKSGVLPYSIIFAQLNPPTTQSSAAASFTFASMGGYFPQNPISNNNLLPTHQRDACGITNTTRPRVVGGIDAKPYSYPWMAALGYQYNNIRFLCAGTLITQTHVLTAGHCVKENLVLARLGAHDITSNSEGAIDVGIGLKIIHENFDQKTIANDIGICKLVQSVPITIAIRPVCLPLDESIRSRDLTYYQPFVAGWGSTSFKGPTARILQEVQLPILPQAECAFNYRLYFPDQVFDDKVLCAGYGSGGKDSCQGDSGGGLVLPWISSDGTYYYYNLIGIVSYGFECARAGFPGVYTRVSTYLGWIQANVY